MWTNWILVAIVTGLVSNLGNFIARSLLKDGDDATAYAWFHEIFRLAFFSIVAVFSFRLTVSPTSLLTLLGLGLIEFAAVYTVMKMHAHNQFSISTIIIKTRLFWIPIISFILFREHLLAMEYVGIIILFLGLAIVTSPKKFKKGTNFTYAYLSGFMTAWVAIFMKLATDYASIPVILVFSALPSVILIPLLMKHGFGRVRSIFKLKLPIKILAGVVNTILMYLFAYSLTLGPASKVVALSQSTMLLAVFAGIVFLKEKDNVTKKIIGSVISLLGVLFLTGFSN